MAVNLLINFFLSSDKGRNNEYMFCLNQNIKNKQIKKVFLFLEDKKHLPEIESEKIVPVVIDERPTFQILIDYANENLDNEICMLSNSDIFFDETLALVSNADLEKDFISLSRWDVKHDHTIEYYDTKNKGWTQDTWIFKSPCAIRDANFVFGIFGQDNRIMKLAFDVGLNVINPSSDIIAKHYHMSNFTGDSGSREEDRRLVGEYLYCKVSKDFKPPPYYDGALYTKSPEPRWTPKRFIKKEETPVVHTEVEAEEKSNSLNVLVTGGTGLVGAALQRYIRHLQKENPFFSPNIKFIGSSDYDLRRPEQVDLMFHSLKPRMVLHLAGKVGGVKANTDCVAEFFFDNLYMNLNVLHFSYVHKVEKLINMLSTCIYPDDVEYPIKEEYLHKGPPHKSNFGYAYAKRMVDVQSRAYRQQYGVNYINVIPNNIFGENDNFDLNDSHVVPAIIRKIYEAKKADGPVSLWGDGSPMRQFTYSYDIAKTLFFLTQKYDSSEPINIGCSEERSIREVAETIADCLGYDGNIFWEADMPSGQKRKPSDLSKLKELGWDDYTDFKEAIKNTCDWFVENYPKVRGFKN